MGELLEFPSSRAQGLAYLDRNIRELLAARGADRDLIDFAARQLTDIYNRSQGAEQYQFNVRLPDALDERAATELKVDIETGLEELRRENHALVLQLIAELVLARVQLFQSRRE
ncbi:hypothetical protein E4634_20410 [Mangrovimicrobium sediminis]|uniref:Uncharacterized protein n=1 Tax=Mangrovimicrobium sediminis TaxID=2562682 RepID=A0A4Z0LV80_9GAMM|nr:hypothetical protein [Haliea sp. SAOS-164]TGD70965.1 hypothetical protein E4634_20410 [Haliea sp. SAOS-164]